MPFFYNLHIQTQVFSACRWSRKPAWCQCTGTTAWRSTGGPARPRSPTGGTYSPTPPPSTSSLPAQPTSGCPGSPSSVHMPSSEPIIAPSLTMAPQSSDHTVIGSLSNIRPDQIKKKTSQELRMLSSVTINCQVNKDCHEFRFSIVRIVQIVVNCQNCQNCKKKLKLSENSPVPCNGWS